MPKLGITNSIVRNHPRRRTLSGGGGSPIPASGLSLWLRADAGVTIDGNDVEAWADQSANSVTAVPWDEYPVFNASDLNGHPTISLSSGGNLRPFELLNANSVMGPTGTTAFAVVYVDDVCGDEDPNGPIFGHFGSTINNDPQSQGHHPYGPDCLVYDAFCTTLRKEQLTSPRPIANAWSLYSVSSQSGDWRSYINGSLMHSTNVNTYNSTPFQGALFIGYQTSNGSYSFKGKIAEAITYNRVLTTPERQQVEAYLMDKYAPCLDATASVLMTGWEYGPRTLAPVGYAPYGLETYQYGDEVVRYDGSAWIYENTDEGEIARSYSPVARPWLATWPAGFTAAKICS